jgi:uncharacterized protein (TIGR02246 family)
MAEDQTEAEVRTLIETLNEAARRKDLKGVMACYANDVVAYDLMPPLETRGAETYSKNWREAFDMSEGPFNIEVSKMTIHAGGDVAFAHALEHITGMGKDGKKFDMYMRSTLGLRKIDGAWRIVHEHGSVPLDMKADKPLWDLKP